MYDPTEIFILFQEEQVYRKWGKYTQSLISRKIEYSQLEKKDLEIIIIKIVFNLSLNNKNLKINFQQVNISYT